MAADPIVIDCGLGAGCPVIDIHRPVDSERAKRDLSGANGPAAYYKRLAEKYRQQYLDVQAQLVTVQRDLEQDTENRERAVAAHCNTIEREKAAELRDVTMKNTILQDQIYEYNQQSAIYMRQNQLLTEENKKLQEQLLQIKAESGATMQEVREETRKEIERMEAKCKQDVQETEEAATKEVASQRDAFQAQVDLMKERLTAQNRTLHEKQEMIDRLVRDNEQLDEEYREMLRKEGEKVEQLQLENFEMRERVQSQEEHTNMIQKTFDDKQDRIERLKLLNKEKQSEINKAHALLGRRVPAAKPTSKSPLPRPAKSTSGKSILSKRKGSMMTSVMSSTLNKRKVI